MEIKQLVKNLIQAKEPQERISKLALIRSCDLNEFVNNFNAMKAMKIWLNEEKMNATGLLAPLLELLLNFP